MRPWAKPMIWPYFRTGAPSGIGCEGDLVARRWSSRCGEHCAAEQFRAGFHRALQDGHVVGRPQHHRDFIKLFLNGHKIFPARRSIRAKLHLPETDYNPAGRLNQAGNGASFHIGRTTRFFQMENKACFSGREYL